MNSPKIATREQWLAARRELLDKEKRLTYLHDELAAERRSLPWVRVEKSYVFEGPSGPEALSDLFGGKSQLVVYHFMLGPGWKEGCPSCSLLTDHLDGSAVHVAARDVAVVLVSRAPFPEIAAFKARMGWGLHWVSSFGSDFNRDYHVSFTQDEVAKGEFYYNFGMTGFPSEEAPGISVFAKDASGAVFHTYSSYARGGEPFITAYQVLDMVPKGRDEVGLPWPMAWVRHHDRYGATDI
ncbi:MAG TPA: thioredoxin family protein [Polyangiaceae bacterium]|nr:thioredoxin family protein [Polyangiaceae bacterium]